MTPHSPRQRTAPRVAELRVGRRFGRPPMNHEIEQHGFAVVLRVIGPMRSASYFPALALFPVSGPRSSRITRGGRVSSFVPASRPHSSSSAIRTVSSPRHLLRQVFRHELAGFVAPRLNAGAARSCGGARLWPVEHEGRRPACSAACRTAPADDGRSAAPRRRR